jgi:hypothetical protein
MGNINVARVILGGLLAGLVMNISETILNVFVVAEESSAIMERLGLQAVGTHQVVIFLAMTFVLGILMVFLYAGLRPRFGAGVKTAIIAGVSVWLVTTMGGVADAVIGITPPSLLALSAIWTLVEMCVGAVVGAWVYKEA